MSNQRLYSAEQVATVLNSSKATVLKYVKQGDLKGQIVGNAMVIQHPDLVSFLESHYKLPEAIIGYRLEERSPKTGKRIQKPAG